VSSVLQFDLLQSVVPVLTDCEQATKLKLHNLKTRHLVQSSNPE
jgi:hypothetical protein